MSMFKCNKCNRVYVDYYPVDDTCIKCNRGIIKIVLVSISTSQSVQSQMSQNIGAPMLT